MDELLQTLRQNVIVVASMRQHPTHRIRVLSERGAVVPILSYESRIGAGIRRYLSDDSRTVVCTAITRTLAFVSDLIAHRSFEGSPIDTCLHELISTSFVDGMEAFRKSYEGDTDIGIHTDRIILVWESIQRRVSAHRSMFRLVS